jgi:hypothetical protein
MGRLRAGDGSPAVMPNALSPIVEQRIVAFALGHPGLGPARISAELARSMWGGPEGVAERHLAGSAAPRPEHAQQAPGAGRRLAAPPEALPREPQPERHLDVDHPGQLVQFDCFCIGRLASSAGVVLWQHTAIDVASAYTWAELHMTPRNPAARWNSALAAGSPPTWQPTAGAWRRPCRTTPASSGPSSSAAPSPSWAPGHQFIHAGRPQTNGCVERVQRTILEECWKPVFARYLFPTDTSLRRELARYCASTTATVLTPVDGPAVSLPGRSWARARCGTTERRRASPPLGGGSD